MDEKMRKAFFPGVLASEGQVVKAFVASNSENALKTRPKVSTSPFCRTCSVQPALRCSQALVSLLVGLPSWLVAYAHGRQ